MIRFISAFCFVSLTTIACSSAPVATPSLPNETSDPSAAPDYYDTVIVSSTGRVRYQHTTPKQYAFELAIHAGRPIPPDDQPTAPTDQRSSPISQDTGCAGSSLWVYDFSDTHSCTTTLDGTHHRIGFQYDGSGLPETATLSSYNRVYVCGLNPCHWETWSAATWMYDPGTNSGSFTTGPENFSANQACTDGLRAGCAVRPAESVT